jgi:hypothetical protein
MMVYLFLMSLQKEQMLQVLMTLKELSLLPTIGCLGEIDQP